jgi:glyoxylase-like metal-dependent hydrolase (beta-lactamase superfamily II)
MSREIINAGSMGVNCYLIKADDCYILIDTGFSFRRRAIQREIENAGCEPGNLKLIIITHGDSDHTGNAVYLRDRYGVKIAMHRAESYLSPGWENQTGLNLIYISKTIMISRNTDSTPGLSIFRDTRVVP